MPFVSGVHARYSPRIGSGAMSKIARPLVLKDLTTTETTTSSLLPGQSIVITQHTDSSAYRCGTRRDIALLLSMSECASFSSNGTYVRLVCPTLGFDTPQGTGNLTTNVELQQTPLEASCRSFQ